MTIVEVELRFVIIRAGKLHFLVGMVVISYLVDDLILVVLVGRDRRVIIYDHLLIDDAKFWDLNVECGQEIPPSRILRKCVDLSSVQL